MATFTWVKTALSKLILEETSLTVTLNNQMIIFAL